MAIRRLTLLSLSIAGSMTAASAAHADAVFTDATFSGYVLAFSTTPTGGGFVYQQCATCGVNGTTGLAAAINDPDGETFSAALINPTFIYDPATQGAIASINASVDKNFFASATTNTYGDSFRLVLEQGGSYYTAANVFTTVVPGPPGNPTSTGYLTIPLSNLTAASFGKFDTTTGAIDSSLHPDFTGGPITFGLGQHLDPSGPANAILESDFDNLSITVTSAAAVPETTTWGMLIGGLGLIGATMRRRRAALRFS